MVAAPLESPKLMPKSGAERVPGRKARQAQDRVDAIMI